MSQAPEIEVVIVSHGSGGLLRRCLQSLRENPPHRSIAITVVDSGSPDSTPEMVEREFPEAKLMREPNIGFSAANNRALAKVLERAGSESPTPFVLLLNPDTSVGAGAIDAAMARMGSDPDIGMVGVKLVTEAGELDHACKRSFPTPLTALAHFTGIGRRRRAPAWLSRYRATGLGEDEAGEVDAVNGAFMLVRTDAVAKVGPLDEGYWLYMEDLDWCRRFWRGGWRVFYEPAGTVVHVKGGSSGRRRAPRQEIAFHRGMGRFYRRYDAPGNPAALNLAVYVGIGLKLCLALLITAARGR